MTKLLENSDLVGKINYEDLLELAGCTKRKAYIPKWMVQRFCPQAEMVYTIEPNMRSFEILYDSVDKFFRTNPNIKKIYIHEKNNMFDGGYIPNIIDHTTYVIKCSF